MAGRTTTNLLHFFKISGRLKTEPRRGWVVKLGMEHPESVADHSYRVVLMTMVYSDARGLDTEKALRMAMLHDLAEAVVGDSIPGEREPREKKKLESSGLRKMLKELPEGLSKAYYSSWLEFEEGESAEAKLVRQLDKVEMAIQASEYRGEDSASDVREFLQAARRSATDPELVGLVESLAE
jgi:putative hydrolases of HD superfamily